MKEPICSLNMWEKNNHPENIWVAGVLCEVDGKKILKGQKNVKILENFSMDLKVFLPGSQPTEFLSSDLVPGDKIAVRWSDTNLQILLIAVNSVIENKDPLASINKIKVSHQWESFLFSVKSFFLQKGFVHLQTPNLVKSTAMEASLHPFATVFNNRVQSRQLFLPTSPEFHLKRALVDGLTEVFEITPCFRNEEVGFQHLPEFTMVEWYRAYARLDDIISDIKGLIKCIDPKLDVNFEKQSIKYLFKKHLAFNLEPTTSKEDLIKLATQLNVHFSKKDSWDDIFHLIFISYIEKHLGYNQIDIIYDYPPSQSAFAKINKSGWADRFEVYWKGFEIANAYNELTCPQTQIQRFEDEMNLKKINKAEVIPPKDDDLIHSLKEGMPFAAGIALGLERLFMAIYGYNDISKLKYFNDLK